MKNYLLLTLLCAFGMQSFAQIANGDFEDWNKLLLFEHPVTGMETMSSNYETFFENGELNVNEIEGPDGQAIRIENIDANGEVMPGFFLFGDVPTPEGENLVFGEGFPASDPGVNGITIDLNYNFPMNHLDLLWFSLKKMECPLETAISARVRSYSRFRVRKNGLQKHSRSTGHSTQLQINV